MDNFPDCLDGKLLHEWRANAGSPMWSVKCQKCGIESNAATALNLMFEAMESRLK